ERPDLASVRCLYYAGCGDLSQWPCLQQSRRSIDVVLASSANRKRRSARLLSISPGPDQPDRLVTSEEIEQAAQRLATRRGERRIVRQHELGVVARCLDQFAMQLDARHPKARHPRLARAEHVAFAAQAQILLGDAEAVLRFAH